MNDLEETFGMRSVSLKFNPSGDEKVIKAKQLIADAIDLLEESYSEKEKTWSVNVFRTKAFTDLISAQMSLVKFLTWKE